MLVVDVLLAALAVLDSQESEMPHLKFLARHQNADGSWGRRPEGCTCPEIRPSPPALDPGALLSLLGDDDPGRRDAAERGLLELGEAALPAVQAGLVDPDAEVRGRCARLWRTIRRRCRGVGDPETTALVLLAYLGAGYSHLSRDVYGEVCVGETVKEALRWLIAHQDREGALDPEDAAGNAVAVLVLCEAYALTGSNFLKEPAGRGLEAILRRTPKDARELAWTALLLVSARSAQHGYDLYPKAGELPRALEACPSTRSSAARAILQKSFAMAKDIALPVLEAAILDPEARLFAAIGLYNLEGRDGRRWREWSPGLKLSILPSMNLEAGRCERGSWEGEGFRGRLRATALNQLSLQVFYRYELRLAAPR